MEVTLDRPQQPRGTRKPRMGGRGCPTCGSHDTEAVSKHSAQWCQTCGHRWAPCSQYCRGYRLDLRHTDGPTITGCPECGVSDRIARHWPEGWRALARELDARKLVAIDDDGEP